MKTEEILTIDTEKMSEEEARQKAIELLKDEMAVRKLLWVALIICILICIPIAFLYFSLEEKPNVFSVILILPVAILGGLLYGFFEGIINSFTELRQYRKDLAAFKNMSYEGSYVAYIRKYQAKKAEEDASLKKHMKKPPAADE